MKKLFISNFSKHAKDPKAISIAKGNPQWYDGLQFPILAPTWNMVTNYKKGVWTEKEYTEAYRTGVLFRCEPRSIVGALQDGSIMLCWCPAGAFCHRVLVADWLKEKLGMEVNELEKE